MAKKYLDYDGLLYFWQKLKTAFSTKAEGVKTITRSGTTFTVTRADDTTFTFTQQDNTVAKTTTTPKMNGTAAIGSETKYAAGDHVHPTDTSRAPLASPALTGTPTAPTAAAITDNTQIATTAFVHDVVDALDTGVSDVKIGTTSIVTDGVATIPESGASATGLMTGAQYTKLKGIEAGAEVNQNAFSNVKVGSTTVAADSKTDTLELAAGTNISLTPDATNDKVTIAFNGTIPTLKNVFGKVKVGSTTIEADTTQDTLELAAGSNITLTPDATNDKVTIAATDTTYSDFTGATSDDSGAHGLVPAPASGEEDYVLTGDGTWENINTTATRTTTSYKINIRLGDKTVTSQTIDAPSDSGAGMMAGIMTGADKTKLNGIATGAEVNQNAFSNVKVGSTTVAADSKTDTLELVAGSNVTLTPDATNDKVTIAASHPTYTSFTGKPTANQTPGFGSTFTISQISQSTTGQVSGTDRTVKIPNATATTSAAGLMSSADKTKLDAVPSSALDLIAGSNITITPNNGELTLAVKGSPSFTGTPTAPTAAAGTNNTQIATTAFVKNAVETAVTGATTFQGTAPTSFAPTNYKAGYYWVIGTAGTYAGQVCEPGDMIFAINDYASAYSASDFDVVQTNLDITSITNAEIDTIVAA